MRSQFDWQTEEEEDWPDEYQTIRKRARPRGRRFPLLLGIAVGVTILAAVAYSLLNRQVRTAATAVEEDILATHELILLAERQGDVELFRAALSGRDASWARELEGVFADGLLFDRTPFSLRVLKGDEQRPPASMTQAKIPEIKLSPDLNAAEVLFERQYAPSLGPSPDQVVTLEHTAVYRRGSRSWLLAPPDPEFWGRRLLKRGKHLAITYYERDRDLLESLALDLDNAVGEICLRMAPAGCPPDLHIDLQLSDRPAALRAGPEGEAAIKSGASLTLPSPTLIGLPLDKAGHEALVRGYSLHLASAVINTLSGYECCRHVHFFQALLAVQLHQVELRPWPLEASHYETLASSQVTLGDIGRYWSTKSIREPFDHRAAVYALLEFLTTEAASPLSRVQQTIVQSGEQPYWAWLDDVAGPSYPSRRELEQAWLGFLGAKSSLSQTAQAPLPDQELIMVCRPDSRQTASLFRYTPETDLWKVEAELRTAGAFLVGLPADDGVVVGEQMVAESPVAVGRTFIYQDGNIEILSEAEAEILPVSFQSVEETGDQRLLLFDRLNRQYSLLSLSQCQLAGGCQLELLPGVPIWSPDGTSPILLVAMGNYGYESRFVRPIVLGTIFGEIVGTGKAPLWLDNETIAFVEPEGRQVIAIHLPDLSDSILFSIDDLASSFAGDEYFEAASTSLEYVGTDPGNADRLLVLAASESGSAYLFRYNRLDGQMTWLVEMSIEPDPRVLYDYHFSPDGRWLIISGYDLVRSQALIQLTDLVQNEVQAYQFAATYDLPMPWHVDWSADGQWLSLPAGGYVRLIAPAYNSQMVIVPDAATCTAAAWANAIPWSKIHWIPNMCNCQPILT